jgi:Protein of unknown function (DUF2878)
MGLSLANIVAFQALWLVCVLGAAHGHDLVGVVVVTVLLPLHMRFIAERRGELTLIAATVAVGFAVDSALALFGVMEFPLRPITLLNQPLWMAALWVNFATTLNHCLRWLVSRPPVAVAFGAIGGPLAYGAGAHLGALSLAEPLLLSLIALALAWGVAMGILSALTRMATLREQEAT